MRFAGLAKKPGLFKEMFFQTWCGILKVCRSGDAAFFIEMCRDTLCGTLRTFSEDVSAL